MNGSTFPTHAAGSVAKFGGVARQMPGGAGEGYGVGVGPKRPSFVRPGRYFQLVPASKERRLASRLAPLPANRRIALTRLGL
jgi:hypothetical protein